MILIFLSIIILSTVFCDNELELKTAITNLQYTPMENSFIQIEPLMTLLNNEYNLNKYHSQYISWKEYPGDDIIYDELIRLLLSSYDMNDIINMENINYDSIGNIIIDENIKNQVKTKLPKITKNVKELNDNYYNVDKGVFVNDYFYCRYYFINSREGSYNITALIFISFETQDKDVFDKISVHISNIIANIPTFLGDVYVIFKKVAIAILLIFTTSYIYTNFIQKKK